MSASLNPNSAVNRGTTVLGTNDGSYAPKTNSAPGAGAQLTAAVPPAEDAPAPVRAYGDVDPVFTQQYDTKEAKVAVFKAELDQAVADLAQDDNYLKWLDVQSRFRRYSFTNQMLIMMQTDGKATRVAGGSTWKKVGRYINKGEKAIGIFAPMKRSIEMKDANGKPILDENGQPKKREWVSFTVVPVFDVAQTNGEPLPEIERELSQDPPEGFVDDMIASAEKAGYSVEFRPMESHANGTAQGWTNPKDKKIVIDASLTPGSQAATLAHELGHVYAGHCDKLDEYHTGPGGCRGRFEVEAESVAYTITRANNMHADGAKLSAQYVAGWSKHDMNALRESAENVAKASKAILESVPFRNVEDDRAEMEAQHQKLVAEGKVAAQPVDENGNPIYKRRTTKKRPAKKTAAKRTAARRKTPAAV